MFREDEWSWYSIPEGKYQPLEFAEHVTRNFNFRNTEFLHFIYTPGIWVQLLFYLSLTSYDLFPHGCKSWATLAAVQKALEGKRNQMEKYTKYTWIFPSWSQFLLSCFSDCGSASKLRWCQKRINSFLSSSVCFFAKEEVFLKNITPVHCKCGFRGHRLLPFLTEMKLS